MHGKQAPDGGGDALKYSALAMLLLAIALAALAVWATPRQAVIAPAVGWPGAALAGRGSGAHTTSPDQPPHAYLDGIKAAWAPASVIKPHGRFVRGAIAVVSFARLGLAHAPRHICLLNLQTCISAGSLW